MKFDNLLYLDKAAFLGVYHTYLHEVLTKVMEKLGFSMIGKRLLADLVIIRIMEPTSRCQIFPVLKGFMEIPVV